MGFFCVRFVEAGSWLRVGRARCWVGSYVVRMGVDVLEVRPLLGSFSPESALPSRSSRLDPAGTEVRALESSYSRWRSVASSCLMVPSRGRDLESVALSVEEWVSR
jgi:hypothetical protein